MPLNDPKYRYYITYNSVQTEVFPLFVDSPKIVFDNPGDQIALLKKFDCKLQFVNKPAEGITDYDYFKNIEDTDKCAVLELDVQQRCGSVYASIGTAEFGTVDGEWDLDNCTFTIEPKPSGVYSCLLSGKKVNILEIPDVYSVTYAKTTLKTLSRMRKFEDVLLYVAQQTCSNVNTIISNFFQINPVTPSAINYVTGTENKYTNMFMGALSDQRDPEPSNQATIENITFRELMDDLRVLFNVYWTVDASNNIRIEHFTYYNTTVGLDLTQAGYDDYTSGTNKYKYIRSDSPRFESWSMAYSKQSCEIEYDNACGNVGVNGSTAKIEYSSRKIFTDFWQAIYDSANLGGNLPGVMLVATYPTLVTGARYMLGYTQNEELTLPHLVLKFHRHGRPQLSGVFKYSESDGDSFDGTAEDLFIYSVRPIKVQTEIKIPLCCDDSFDSSQKVETVMGEGVVITATHDLEDETLSLTLKHKIESDNADIEPDDLSGLQLWLKGDTGKTITSGRVTQWNDQSGNSNHAVQATVANAPTDGGDYLNFLPGWMQTTNPVTAFTAKRGSIFVVHKTNNMDVSSTTTDRTILATDATNKWDISFKYAFDSGTDTWFYHSFILNTDYPAEGYVASNLMTSYGWCNNADYNDIMLFELIRDADTTESIWHNGKKSGLNPVTVPNVNPDADNIYIGTIDGTNKKFEGHIYEIIIYNRALTAIERQQIEQYLSKKYEMNLYHIS
jgi:hypothetical protein